MAAISVLSNPSQTLSEAQGLVAAIRTRAEVPSSLGEPLSRLQALLERAQAQIADGQKTIDDLSEKLGELSAIVVASNVRHF